MSFFSRLFPDKVRRSFTSVSEPMYKKILLQSKEKDDDCYFSLALLKGAQTLQVNLLQTLLEMAPDIFAPKIQTMEDDAVAEALSLESALLFKLTEVAVGTPELATIDMKKVQCALESLFGPDFKQNLTGFNQVTGEEALAFYSHQFMEIFELEDPVSLLQVKYIKVNQGGFTPSSLLIVMSGLASRSNPSSTAYDYY